MVTGATLTARQLIHATRTPSIDFIHVWSAAHQLIGSGGAYRDPLFTYPPSAAILLSPFGAVSYSTARTAMLAVNVVAITAAGLLLARELATKIGPRGVVLLLLVVGGLDSVASTWANGNINGLLVLVEVLAIRWLLRQQALPSALAVGISLALKPVLIPLLALFVVRRRWRALLVALTVPVLLNVVGMIVVSDARRYFTVVLPYLIHGAQLPFNDSLVGVGYRFGLSGYVVVILRVVVAACAIGLYARCAFGPTHLDMRGQLFAEVAIGLVAIFLVGPMSEAYYTLFLLPALAWLAATRRSAAVAVVLITVVCFATLRLTGVPNDLHRSLSWLALRPTFGWVAMLGLVALTPLVRPMARPKPPTPSPSQREASALQPASTA